MSSYNITRSPLAAPAPGTLLRLFFGTPAQNDQIVRDAAQALADLGLPGGELVLLNGPATNVAMCAIAHGVGHLYQAVGVFDPKMAGYVVAVAHSDRYSVGDVIPAGEVKEA